VTVADALARATRLLAAAGVPSPEWDAELLLRHVTGWDRTRVLADPAAILDPDHLVAFDDLVAKRARRIPLQHLTGTQAFWRHDFEVTPDVLIPRPDTELLVESALERLTGPQPVIVDVGTGSGCIAISLAAERPDAVVHAIDLSQAALAVAARNAASIGVAVTFHRGDLLAPLAGAVLDLVVSNPPYVRAEDR
jgi:release factor glutamine methyltransferase